MCMLPLCSNCVSSVIFDIIPSTFSCNTFSLVMGLADGLMRVERGGVGGIGLVWRLLGGGVGGGCVAGREVAQLEFCDDWGMKDMVWGVVWMLAD